MLSLFGLASAAQVGAAPITPAPGYVREAIFAFNLRFGVMRHFGNLLFCILTFGSAVATGAPLLETLNYARFYGANDPRVTYACENFNGLDCNGSVIAPGTNWTVNYFSTGSGDFGVMRNRASVSLSGDNSLGPFSSFVSIGSRSGYRDIYTIGGGVGEGTINFDFGVTGSTSRSGGAGAGPLFQYVPIVNGQYNFAAARNYGVVGGRSTVSVDFTFGEPIEFVVYFYALAQVFQWIPDSFSDADFLNTAVLDRITVFDNAGVVIPEFSIESESGTRYSSNGVLPNPSTLSLLTAGLIFLGLSRKKVKRFLATVG